MPAEIIPRTLQAINAKRAMIRIWSFDSSLNVDLLLDE
jgi:hypothetical protein